MNRRGRVVEAGRVTTAAGMLFAEFHRAIEGGEPHATRLVDPVTPKAPALVALESPPAPGTTPRRRNLAPRLERGGADLNRLERESLTCHLTTR
jgi:hypothetical protein